MKKVTIFFMIFACLALFGFTKRPSGATFNPTAEQYDFSSRDATISTLNYFSDSQAFTADGEPAIDAMLMVVGGTAGSTPAFAPLNSIYNHLRFYGSVAFDTNVTATAIAVYLAFTGVDINNIDLYKCPNGITETCNKVTTTKDATYNWMRYNITDQGTYDDDSAAGAISDPVYVATVVNDDPYNSTSGGGGGSGGCSASKDGSPFGFILMFLVSGAYLIRRKIRH